VTQAAGGTYSDAVPAADTASLNPGIGNVKTLGCKVNVEYGALSGTDSALVTGLLVYLNNFHYFLLPYS
jgi:hypothetical protein